MLAQCLFNIFSGVISGVLSVWFKMCLSFLSVWFRVDSGLGQWFIAGWLEVGAKFYLKSVQGLIRNLLKIHVSFRFGFGFVLGWVNPLFGIPFRALRCACSFLREGFKSYLSYLSIYIYIYIHR